VLPVREVAMEGANRWRFVPLGEGRHAYPHCKGRPYRWSRVVGGLVGHDKGGGQAGAIPLAHGKGGPEAGSLGMKDEGKFEGPLICRT